MTKIATDIDIVTANIQQGEKNETFLELQKQPTSIQQRR